MRQEKKGPWGRRRADRSPGASPATLSAIDNTNSRPHKKPSSNGGFCACELVRPEATAAPPTDTPSRHQAKLHLADSHPPSQCINVRGYRNTGWGERAD